MANDPIELFADITCPFAHAAIMMTIDRRPAAIGDLGDAGSSTGEPIEGIAGDAATPGRRGGDAGGIDDHHRLVVRAWPLEMINDDDGPGTDLIAREIDGMRRSVTPDLFTGFDPSTFPTTSLPAFVLVAAAYRQGPAVGEAVSLEVRDRLWERGEDVSDPDVLAEVAERHGLEVTDEDRRAAERDHVDGSARGVVGSPHAVIGDHEIFCPTFSVSRDDAGDFVITPEPGLFDGFLDLAFGRAG